MRKIKIYVLLIVLSFLFCGTVFAAEGDVIWTRTYDSPGAGEDGGYGIAVDGSGNVYVTGYVTGVEHDVWVGKYTSDGYLVWTSTYNGTGNVGDEGRGIAVDRNGNVYVTGYETVTGEGRNIWVRKYTSGGGEVWTKTYNGPAPAPGGNDEGHGIAVDGSGNVYVSGCEYDTSGKQNIWVRKYTSGGDEVWTTTYNGIFNGSDEGYGIAVDGSGNIYVTGFQEVSGTLEIWVRKYDSDGNEVWTRTQGGPPAERSGSGIAVDGSGNVYVSGADYDAVKGYSIWVRKYDSEGEGIWTRTYDSPGEGEDGGYGIAVDGSGNVYVTGYETVTGEEKNIWVRKYNPNGDEIWTRTHNGSLSDDDEGHGIAVDGSGNVCVAGVDWDAVKGWSIWVRKYEGAFGENFQPPVQSEVKIQGGEKGYVNPKKGEVAKIHFLPSGSGVVKVKIYTLRGQLVWEGSKSVSGPQDFIEWDGRNKDNDVVASGIYVVYVEGPGIKATKKIAVLK